MDKRKRRKRRKKSTKCQNRKERNYKDWRRTKERGGKEEKRRRNSSRRWRRDTMTGDLCWQPAASTWRSPCCVVFFFSVFFSLTNKKFMEWRGRWPRERWEYFGFGDLWVWFVLGVYCVWRNLWDEEEDDEEGDGKLFWFWFGFVLICTVLVCVGKGRASWKGKGRASGFRRLLLRFFF